MSLDSGAGAVHLGNFIQVSALPENYTFILLTSSEMQKLAILRGVSDIQTISQPRKAINILFINKFLKMLFNILRSLKKIKQLRQSNNEINLV